MMVRPCEDCGGQGVIRTADNTRQCPRCIEMPWLLCKHGQVKPHSWIESDFEYESHFVECPGRWKPDPTAVLRWCMTHWSAMSEGTTCFYWLASPAWQPVETLCTPVWIERPMPLREATDE